MSRLLRLTALLIATLTATALAAAPSAAQSSTFPDVIELPVGFFPEGIATGSGTDVYAGSLADGAIWKGDLRTGEGSILVEGVTGTLAVGLNYDNRSGNLWVAGGSQGLGSVYDGDTGELIDRFDLGAGFINDVYVARDAAYFTNSFAPELYAVPLDARGNVTGEPTTITLGDGFDFVPGGFNANGIVATQDGSTLIVAASAAATLYLVDPATGEATAIDLDGASISGDGLVLIGRTLYVNQNSLNQISVIQLSGDLTSGTVVDTLTSDAYDVPTTSAAFGSSLYAVNAKFGTSPVGTSYEIVRVDR